MNQIPSDPTDSFLYKRIYSFDDSSGHTYLVYLEKYNYELYAIKFHLKSHKLSEKKYNLLTNNGHCSRIIRTCIQIMVDYLRNENPRASFIFSGTNSENEEKSNTKRFRLYSKVMKALFTELEFEHKENIVRSTYILLNKRNKESNLLNKIEVMFSNIYELI